MHTFLALDMNTIPQATKDNVPTFWCGLFSNDKSRMLIDGYISNNVLVHCQYVLDSWLQWESDPSATQELIISNAIEYTYEQVKTMQKDPESIWYIEEDEL
tara:strand:+ start:1683 stop:1985 length:303 start_codon:yes stop_codon:yes gene_type:complete